MTEKKESKSKFMSRLLKEAEHHFKANKFVTPKLVNLKKPKLEHWDIFNSSLTNKVIMNYQRNLLLVKDNKISKKENR